MLLLKLAQKVVKILIGDATPGQIAGGFALGAIIGLTPIFSLHNLLVVLLVCIIRVSVFSVIVSAVLFGLLSYLINPISHQLGYLLLVNLGFLKPLWTFLYNLPIIPFSRFNNTLVLGSLVISLALFYPILILVRKLVLKHRPSDTPDVIKMRWKGIIAFAVICLLIVVFGVFFMDNLIKGAIESFGSDALGAKIEIKEFELSFLKLFLRVNNLQIADPADEWRNQLDVGEIRFKLEWLPLLYGKIVVNEMVIDGIRSGTTRTTSGKIVTEPKKTTVVEQSQGLIAREVDVLSASQPASGVNIDELIKPEQLTALTEINKTQNELNTRYQNAQSALENLNISTRLDEIKRQIDAIDLKEKNPAKLQKELKKLKGVKKDIDRLTDDLNQTDRNVQAGFGAINNSIKQIDRIKEADYERIIRTIGGGVDKENIARLVFGPLYLNYVNEGLSYLDMAREYMPPQGVPKEEPPRWTTGIDVEFSKEKSYPVFLLRTALISTGGRNLDELRFEGNAEGISSDPALYGKPMTISLKGTSPVFDLEGVMDHTTAIGRDSVQLNITGLDLKGFGLGKLSLLPEKISQGQADITANFLWEGDKIEFNMTIVPRELLFAKEDISSGELAQEIARALSSTQNLKIEGKVYGDKKGLNLKISSTIDDLIVEAFKKSAEARLGATKQQIKQRIDQMVDNPKEELLKDFQSKNGSINTLIKNKHESVGQLREHLDSKLGKAEK